jgi:hypothetical protein
MDLSEYDMTNVPGFMKNRKTGVIINTNTGQYDMILAQRKKAKEELSLMQRFERMERNLKLINEKLGIEI